MAILDQLIRYWESQNITVLKASPEHIAECLKNKGIVLPDDFIHFYLNANGMQSIYFTGVDDNGFLFYPIENVVRLQDELKSTNMLTVDPIYIFADYMQKSWWYGVKFIRPDSYQIGIIPDENTFRVITDSLEEFINLYLNDAEDIYY